MILGLNILFVKFSPEQVRYFVATLLKPYLQLKARAQQEGHRSTHL